jgi:hypothetical protein
VPPANAAKLLNGTVAFNKRTRRCIKLEKAMAKLNSSKNDKKNWESLCRKKTDR